MQEGGSEGHNDEPAAFPPFQPHFGHFYHLPPTTLPHFQISRFFQTPWPHSGIRQQNIWREIAAAEAKKWRNGDVALILKRDTGFSIEEDVHWSRLQSPSHGQVVGEGKSSLYFVSTLLRLRTVFVVDSPSDSEAKKYFIFFPISPKTPIWLL